MPWMDWEGVGAERDVTNTPERARSPRPCLGEHPPLLAALQAEHPPCARPAPLPGRGRGRCGSSGCLIQLTNSRQDRCAIPRRLPLGGEGAPRGRGRGGDVTARQLTSGAPRQESLSKRARLGLCSECVLAYIRVRPCARVHTRVSMRRSPHPPPGDALALGVLCWVHGLVQPGRLLRVRPPPPLLPSLPLFAL